MIEILVAIGAFVAAVVIAFFKGKSTERTAQKAKEADAYEQHLKDVSGAHDARNAVSGGLPEHDKYRRD
jgi:predicted ATPase with chaperone activity